MALIPGIEIPALCFRKVREFLIQELSEDEYHLWKDMHLEHLRNVLMQFYCTAPMHIEQNVVGAVEDLLHLCTSFRFDNERIITMGIPQRRPHMLPSLHDVTKIADKYAVTDTARLLSRACDFASSQVSPVVPSFEWDLAADQIMMYIIPKDAHRRIIPLR